MVDTPTRIERLQRYIQRWRIKRSYVNVVRARTGRHVGFSPLIDAYQMMEDDGIISIEDDEIVWNWPEDYDHRMDEAKTGGEQP